MLPGDRAEGYSYFTYGGTRVRWAGKQSLRYLSPSSFPEGSDPQTLLIAGMGLWVLVPACDFVYYYDPNGLDSIDNYDGYNDTIAAELDTGVLAVTYMVNNGAYWYDMDQAYSPLPAGVGWTFDPNPTCQTINNAATQGYSLLLVATHELGHALGLGHDPLGTEPAGSPWFIGTMNPRYPAGGPIGQENIVETHADDRAGTRFLYPHTGPSEPPYRDAANAGYSSAGGSIGKAVPAAFSPTSMYPGAVVTARSVLENFGTTNLINVRQGFYLSSDDVITTADYPLGDVRWDIGFEDGIEFDAEIDMPADYAAGTYHLGSIFDDTNEIAEEYEDNNAAVFCTPLVINRMAPVINPINQQMTPCGVPYTGPAPTVTHPINMAPITWSVLNPQPGMTINSSTGVISWPSPVRSEFLYTIYLKATNSAGNSTVTLYLGVTASMPQIVAIPNAVIDCYSSGAYTGPTPQITSPSCMNPIINWSLDVGPVGMTINHNTGVVSWSSPVPGVHPITIRATNAVGNGTESWTLTITRGADVDGGGTVNAADLNRMVNVLTGQDTVPAHVAACDLNGDGSANGKDIQLFVNCYITGH
jgi:hypothetical protein